MIDISFYNLGIILSKKGHDHYISFGNILRIQRTRIKEIWLDESEQMQFKLVTEIDYDSANITHSYRFKWFLKNKLPRVLTLDHAEWLDIMDYSAKMEKVLDPFCRRQKIFLNTEYGLKLMNFFIDEWLLLCDDSTIFEKSDFDTILHEIDLYKSGAPLDDLKNFRCCFRDDILKFVEHYLYPPFFSQAQPYDRFNFGEFNFLLDDE